MNVCDDHILRTRHDSKIVHAAKRELLSLEEILTDEGDDRSKCARILRLMEGPEQCAAKGGEYLSPSHVQVSLSSLAHYALGKLKPESLQSELVMSMVRADEEYSTAAQELVDLAELGDNKYLGDLTEEVRRANPIILANTLAKVKPPLDLQRIPYRPPLEVLKAVLKALVALDN
jgi:hypothetical protein